MDLGFGDLPNDDCELSRWFDRPDFGARPTQNIAPKALAQPPMPRFYDYSLEPGLHQGFTPALHTGRAADLPGRRLHRRLGATDYDTAHGPTPTPPQGGRDASVVVCCASQCPPPRPVTKHIGEQVYKLIDVFRTVQCDLRSGIRR